MSKAETDYGGDDGIKPSVLKGDKGRKTSRIRARFCDILFGVVITKLGPSAMDTSSRVCDRRG